MALELIRACFFILMAEIGDKTQILAMAFATKYKTSKVLLGVFIGALLNHGLAVLLGSYLSSVIPLGTIRLIASSSFIAFGLWTLKDDGEEKEEKPKEKYGAVVTVALAFFIGELGDKTQFTAIALSSEAQYPFFILMGTVLGMVIVSGIGIFVGSRLGKRIPEFAIKIISASIFILFGVIGLFEELPQRYLTGWNIALFALCLAAAISLLLLPALRRRKRGKESVLKEVAQRLKDRVSNMKGSVEEICMGENSCGNCKGMACSVGYMKSILSAAIREEKYSVEQEYRFISVDHTDKSFDREKLRKGLDTFSRNCLNCGKAHSNQCVLNQVRVALETEYLGHSLDYSGNIQSYKKMLDDK